MPTPVVKRISPYVSPIKHASSKSSSPVNNDNAFKKLNFRFNTVSLPQIKNEINSIQNLVGQPLRLK